MTSPDFFERLRHDPASIAPQEYLITGVATVKASMEKLPEHGEKGAKWLMLGMAVTSEGLRQIRTGSDFTEQERLKAALTVFGQAEIHKLPPACDMPLASNLQLTYAETLRDFLDETYRTLASGFSTTVQARIEELSREFNYGNCVLGAMMVLSRVDTDGKAMDEIRYLDNLGPGTKEQKRMTSVAWARRLTPVMDHQDFAEVVGYFVNHGDMEAVLALTEVKIKGLPKPAGKHRVDFLAKIPWDRLDVV